MCLVLARAELADNTECNYFETLTKECWERTKALMGKLHHRHDQSIVCGKAGSLLTGIYVQHYFGDDITASVVEFHRVISYKASSTHSQVPEVPDEVIVIYEMFGLGGELRFNVILRVGFVMR